MELELNFKKFNPNAYYLLQYFNDVDIRFIILFGGSSSGKSFSVAQSILVQTLLDGENTLVMRKVGASILKTVYEDYKVAAKGLGVSDMFKFTQNSIRCLVNGAKIDFSGLDDPEKIKGISNYKRVQLEEWSEFEEADFKQMRKRLRGKKGQQIICTFNPISGTHWIKKNFLDKQKWHEIPMVAVVGGVEIPKELTQVKSIRMNEVRQVRNVRTQEIEEHAPDTVVIQSTYLNNFWVVGSPDGTYGFYDEQCVADFERDRVDDPDYYNVYALGEWGIIKTGGEFFGSFKVGTNTGPTSYNPNLPVHLSVDNNVLPYISISYWQAELGENKRIYQFMETAAESPINTARKASNHVGLELRKLGVTDKVYLHGDASTRAANTIDEEKRSWLDLFISGLKEVGTEVVDCVGNKNPSVPMSGEFINSIFENQVPGLNITIGEQCTLSIEDYMAVQKDANGAILKTRIKDTVTKASYEAHGHLSDTFRYVVTDIFNAEFIEFSNRRKRNMFARDGFLQYYNPINAYTYTDSLLYIMPSVNGKFLFAHAGQCGTMWNIISAGIYESTEGPDVASLVNSVTATVIVECPEAYFLVVRKLRSTSSNTIRAMKDQSDYSARIAATADLVKEVLRFNPESTDSSYVAFVQNLLDYNQTKENYEASALISGLSHYISRNFVTK